MRYRTAIPFARGRWLLFTDADTIHSPGALKRSLAEAEEHRVSLLSYSPHQETGSFWEKAVQPVIFAELSRSFAYEQVNSAGSDSAAANGQYILISRAAYDAIGGHAAVKGSLLEDVELARATNKIGKLQFRYAPDAVSARMYQGPKDLITGWTKNLTAALQRIINTLYKVRRKAARNFGFTLSLDGIMERSMIKNKGCEFSSIC